MILESYDEHRRAKSLGFIQSPVTKLWESPNSIVIDDNESEELGFNIGNITGSLTIRHGNLKTLKGLENAEINSLGLINLKNLESLEYYPKFTDELQVIDCSIKNLKGIKVPVMDMILSGCYNLTSLEGLPNTIQTLKIINCNLPTIEEDFAVHIGLHGFENYHIDLLKFMVKAKREAEIDTVSWPEEFKKNLPEMLRSVGGLNKFNI